MTDFLFKDLIRFIKPLQIESFRAAFDYLDSCTLAFDGNSLIVTCHTPDVVDQLNDDREILPYLAWLKTGCRQTDIYFLQQLIFRLQYNPISDQAVSLGTSQRHSPMIATLSETAPPVESVPVESVPGQLDLPIEMPPQQIEEVCSIELLVVQLAQKTGQTEASCRASIERFAPTIIQFGTQILIPISTTDVIVDRHCESIKPQIKAALHLANLTQPIESVVTDKPVSPPAQRAAATKSTAKKTQAKRKTTTKKPAAKAAAAPEPAPTE